VEIRDLSHDEKTALVALVELLVSSDKEASEDEADRIAEIAHSVGGPEAYRLLAEEVDRRFADEDDLKAFLATIERQEARELVFERALELAMPDGIRSHEAEFLEWLERQWNLNVLYLDESEESSEE
jgi:integrase